MNRDKDWHASYCKIPEHVDVHVLHGIEEAQKERVKAAEVIHTLALELHLLVIELYLLALELYLGLDLGCERLRQSNTRQTDRIHHPSTDCRRPRVKQGLKFFQRCPRRECRLS